MRERASERDGELGRERISEKEREKECVCKRCLAEKRFITNQNFLIS